MALIKIRTKKDILMDKLSKSLICNAKNKGEHCLTNCFHGIPHEREVERGSCHQGTEICTLSLGGIVRVHCKKLTKKQVKEFMKNES